MTKRTSDFIKGALLCTSLGMLFLVSDFERNLFNAVLDESSIKIKKTVESRAKMQEGRKEHYLRLLKSPGTNKVPDNIRFKELKFAEELNRINRSKTKSTSVSTPQYQITEIGPTDVSGRTRALAIDSRNKDILIAGGVSGGIWKSTNGGINWTLKSEPTHDHSVSAVVQDPLNLDTWYYSTAEFFGSARARGGGGVIYGSGFYKSTDNGESWTPVSSTATGSDPFLPDVNDTDVSFNSVFDFISNLDISPTTGTQFFSSNAFGIFRSTDGFVNNTLALGAGNNHVYSDVQVASNGNVIAVVSNAFSGVSVTSQPGVYLSVDDGLTWEDITPAAFPASHNRSVIGVSPSNPDVFFVFTDTGGGANGLTLFRFNTVNFPTSVSAFNRSNGIPNFGEPVGDQNPQGGYNLICKVHPTDPNMVFIGGTNLFRSTTGFNANPPTDGQGNTDPSVANEFWIGGYASVNNVSLYQSHHPDQHNLVFDPTNPNRAFSAHDGGISMTQDITAEPVVWARRENGYNITQFYHVSIHPEAGNTQILGGTQDNGTPYFNYNLAGSITSSTDLSSGDGSHSFVGNDFAIVSSQNGRILSYKYDNSGNIDPFTWSYISPLGASSQLFIHPFAVDPVNEDIVAYPDGGTIWINNRATTILRNTSDPNGTTIGWTELTNVTTGPSGHIITALEFSSQNPTNRLYYAGFADDLKPVLFRLNDAGTATNGEFDISIPAAPADAYIHDIGVNPEDGDEIIAVISNYETESVYHSTNGGLSWSGVGGNLEGENGPSVRSVAFAKDKDNNTVYFVGTSTGLYATTSLSGGATIWEQQGPEAIGNVVIEHLDYRSSDKTLAVGTHGRGMFLAQVGIVNSNEEESSTQTPTRFLLSQNYPNPFNPTTNISYSLPSSAQVTISVYDVNGRKVSTLISGEQKNAGEHQLTFDAANLASGIYLYRISAISNNGRSSFSDIKKMTLIK